MKYKTMPVAKKAIQELSGDELTELVEFGKSEAFKIFVRLSELEKYKRYQDDFLSVNSMEQINFLKGLNVGIDFIIDSVNRAKEELRNRGDKEEFDKED